ncbi:MAG: hypothetical protein WCC98_15860 [Candidatus Acidiferrales bacterium]
MKNSERGSNLTNPEILHLQRSMDMNKQRQFRDRSNDRRLTLQRRPMRRPDPIESQLEYRLNILSNRFEAGDSASCNVWPMVTTARLSEPGDSLRVKIEAVRWMLRVAKHLNDAARGKVLLTINRSLDDLERATVS